MEQRNPSRFQGVEYPVESVTYLQACAALERLNKHFRDIDSPDVAVLPLGGALYEISLAQAQRNAELAGASLPARTMPVWALPDGQEGLFGFIPMSRNGKIASPALMALLFYRQPMLVGTGSIRPNQAVPIWLRCGWRSSANPRSTAGDFIGAAKTDLQWFRPQRMPQP